jgi:glycosyltransferase involved in cell wall biosynthesis/ribosomal protein S18 acetylase RimI-like enzyme
MKLRIAHVANVDLSVRVLLLPQLLRLRDEGFDVTAISRPGPFVREIEAAGIRHLPWHRSTRSWDPRSDASAYRELVGILGHERFDLVHTHNPKAGVIGRIAARRAGVPCVVNTVHGLYATQEDALRRTVPVLALEALAARASDLELFQSEEDLTWAERIGLGGRVRRVLLGNGIDVRAFDASRVSRERRAEVRRELGVAEGALLVGTVARLVAEKGVREFLAAARALRSPEMRFVIVGPREPDKLDAIPDDELERPPDGVVFAGWREDVRDLIAAMDVFVLASWREGLPRSALEAASMGKPLVLTDIRGCREVARDGVEGVLVPPRDPARLARAIARLRDDPGLRSRLGAAAKDRARERFDEERVFGVLLGEYERLLAAKHLRARASVSVSLRSARGEDIPAVARLHRETMPGAFMSKLGERFLRRFYRALLEHRGAVLLVAEEQDGPVVGFAAAAVSMREFSREFYRRHGLAAAAAAGLRMLRGRAVHGVLESARYAGTTTDPDAEYISMGVAAPWRGRGVARMLTRRVLVELGRLGVDTVRLMIADDNDDAMRHYSAAGLRLRRAGRIVVHRGATSTVWVTDCPS